MCSGMRKPAPPSRSMHPIAPMKWEQLPKKIQEEIIHKKLKFYVINASKVARGKRAWALRINSILQTCFFAISNVMTRDLAIQYIKSAIKNV